jgi:hypothetical protein
MMRFTAKFPSITVCIEFYADSPIALSWLLGLNFCIGMGADMVYPSRKILPVLVSIKRKCNGKSTNNLSILPLGEMAVGLKNSIEIIIDLLVKLVHCQVMFRSPSIRNSL